MHLLSEKLMRVTAVIVIAMWNRTVSGMHRLAMAL
jgi:hypothetical protein